MSTFYAFSSPAAGHTFPLVPGLLELQVEGAREVRVGVGRHRERELLHRPGEGEVAEMDRAVGIGQGAGNEDLAGHEAVFPGAGGGRMACRI